MRAYLVESFCPKRGPAEVGASSGRAELEATAMRARGSPIAYLGALHVEQDEVVFHLFRAADEGLVTEAVARAGLRVERLVEVAVIDPAGRVTS